MQAPCNQACDPPRCVKRVRRVSRQSSGEARRNGWRCDANAAVNLQMCQTGQKESAGQRGSTPLSSGALGAGAMRLRRQAPWPAAASRSRRVMMPRTWLCSSTTHRWRSPSETKAVCAKKADVSCLQSTRNTALV